MMIKKREEKTYDNTDDRQIDKKREKIPKRKKMKQSRKKRKIKTPHIPTWAWA